MSDNHRARVIYQSEALYAGTVDATGHHFSTASNWTTRAGYKTHATYADAVAESAKLEQEFNNSEEYKAQTTVFNQQARR